MAGKSRRRIGGEGDEIFDRQLDDFDQIDGKRRAELGQHLRLVAQGRALVILTLVPDPPVEFHVIGPVDEPDVVVGKVTAEQERGVFGHGLEGIENAGRTMAMSSPRNDDPDRHVDTIKIRLVLDVDSVVVVVTAATPPQLLSNTKRKMNEGIQDYLCWLIFATCWLLLLLLLLVSI
jgi:hypothetical protein